MSVKFDYLHNEFLLVWWAEIIDHHLFQYRDAYYAHLMGGEMY